MKLQRRPRIRWSISREHRSPARTSNCVMVSRLQASHALCGADRAAFNEALDSANGSFFRDAHGSKRVNGFGIGKGCRARRAAISLDSVPSVTAKFFNSGALASGAGHKAFPLEFWREKPENELG